MTGVPVLRRSGGHLTLTLVVQAPSATSPCCRALQLHGGRRWSEHRVGLDGAIPILLGDNLGATITALLAISQSATPSAWPCPTACFNLSGCLLFIVAHRAFASVVAAIPSAGPEVEIIARQIANAHTLFNVTMTALWLPLVSVMVKIVMAILPEKPRRPRDPLVDTLETPLAPDAAAATAATRPTALPAPSVAFALVSVARRSVAGRHWVALGGGWDSTACSASRLFDALPPISPSARLLRYNDRAPVPERIPLVKPAHLCIGRLTSISAT